MGGLGAYAEKKIEHGEMMDDHAADLEAVIQRQLAVVEWLAVTIMGTVNVDVLIYVVYDKYSSNEVYHILYNGLYYRPFNMPSLISSTSTGP